MKGLQQYLPSAQFTLIVVSVALSGGVVFAAQQFTKANKTQEHSTLVAASQQTSDWQQMLRDIQAQNSTYTLPPAPDTNAVQDLLTAAQTSNVTESVGRTLLVNLSDAKAQGLGNDIPTQDKLVDAAAQQIVQERGDPLYTTAQLQTIASTQDSLHTYGNSVMSILNAHPAASYYQTLLVIGNATDNSDGTKLALLKAIGQEYKALAQALAAIPVPQTLLPLHLQIVNNIARMAQTYPDMQLLVDDPLHGLSGLQLYQSLMDETARVFTNIAQQLQSNGILFDTSEPGNTWSSLLP